MQALVSLALRLEIRDLKEIRDQSQVIVSEVK